jgi:hypothetical protein
VLVKKKNGKCRMCVDYTSLNKACPKHPFLLPRIDQIVDSTTGCELLSFLDAYSGYHQIKIKESDQLATSFHHSVWHVLLCNHAIWPKNAGATYQQCMLRVFGDLIGRTIEAYVDDIVANTREASDLVTDLDATFCCLKKKNIKLNPKKCLWCTPRHALGICYLRVWHRGQPRKNLDHR